MSTGVFFIHINIIMLRLMNGLLSHCYVTQVQIMALLSPAWHSLFSCISGDMLRQWTSLILICCSRVCSVLFNRIISMHSLRLHGYLSLSRSLVSQRSVRQSTTGGTFQLMSQWRFQQLSFVELYRQCGGVWIAPAVLEGDNIGSNSLKIGFFAVGIIIFDSSPAQPIDQSLCKL